MTNFLKRCWLFLAICIITAAVVTSFFRALTPWAKQYKGEVEQHLSTLLGEPVSIKTMETGWYWLEPVIKLKQLRVTDAHQTIIKLDKLLVGINLFSSLWHWQLQPGILYISDLHLNLRQSQDSWKIEGLRTSSTMAFDSHSYQTVLTWILAQQKIIIKNLSAHVYLQDNSVIALRDLNLSIANQSGHYRIKAWTHLAQPTATNFNLLAKLTLNPAAPLKASGQVFVSIENLLVTQWQNFAPQSRFKLLNGQSDLQCWADLTQGQLKNLQMQVNFDNLAWLDKSTTKKQNIENLKANFAWQPSINGWQLAADHIHLLIDKKLWPENSFLLNYKKNTEEYSFFIKNIMLDSLPSLSLAWPELGRKALAAELKGQLHDTQIQVKEKKLAYILTGFSSLGWKAEKEWPGVANLSGVLNWQPTEGRLELDAEKATVVPLKKAPIEFTNLNTAIDWKELSNGLRISVERFVLEHPQLLVSASGVADGVTTTTAGQIRMAAQWSATEAQQWLPYLPRQYLKPKLDTWLKHDIKRIQKTSGELSLNGNYADFPFDTQPGEFSIKGYLNGVDLMFAPHWPLARHIEAYLQLTKRDLEVDILHANLNDLSIDNGHLSVDGLGLGKETLLLHTKIQTEAKKALNYVLASPLRKKLSALAMLSIKGPLELDFQLEAPLYPENDEILVLGDINFKKNYLLVHHSIDDVELKELSGSLQFNQKGILDSNLNTLIFNYPVNLFIKTVEQPLPSTEIKLKGKTTIQVLRNKFNLPILSLMEGSFWLEGLLVITDEPGDLDHLQLQTSLKGLDINLPAPLGKGSEVEAPLLVDIDFNPTKAIRVRFNYDKRLSSDLWFLPVKNSFAFQKGEVYLGDGQLTEPKHAGLGIRGSLATFNLEHWLETQAKITDNHTHQNILAMISFIDISLKQAQIWGMNYNDLVFKAFKESQDQWSIHIKEPTIRAQLTYQGASNTISGKIQKLYLQKFTKKEKEISTLVKLHPQDLPNLNLQIASFQYDGLELGEVFLKAQLHNQDWLIEDLKIKTPFYQIAAKGEWKEENNIPTTKITADLKVSDLAKSLEKWSIIPVVEAHGGNILFQGGWPGAIYDFSLAKLKGQMLIYFKNGRITHLSPETEEKLGLGKLLSILSLQTIPRRLKLDFSDLSQDGYSFDEFKGHFSVSSGVMTTQDSYIDGPVAYASMKGELNILKQLYDLDLKVSPHITASLPIVATIAGGPIAGLATWIVSKIINQGMQKISGYTYKISGPWKAPIVQQVKIIKKPRT